MDITNGGYTISTSDLSAFSYLEVQLVIFKECLILLEAVTTLFLDITNLRITVTNTHKIFMRIKITCVKLHSITHTLKYIYKTSCISLSVLRSTVM